MLCRCALFAIVLALLSTTVRAEEANAHPLPIRRVVLFTSGVAFIEHRGEVEGDATIDFKFHVDDVNDLLKSMVVQDEGGGRIETVTYAPQEPLSLQLGVMRLDPSRVRSLGDLLAQLRGEKVELELTPNVVQGTIIAVERRKQQLSETQTIDQETLLLKTEKGLRNVSLATVASVKLLNEALDRDLQKALDLLASSSSTEKKSVSLRLKGEGKRQVRVGYVQEFPVWKTSYRLVLDEKKKPLLQGWAIVENTTDHDWTNVQISLVSGRPVSFVMDLYQPLYLERPTVVPQLFAGLRPRVRQQDLAAAEEAFRQMADGSQRGPGYGGLGGGMFGGGGLGGGFGGGGAAQRPFTTSVIPVVGPGDARSSLQVAAQGAQVGASFRYAIEQPVTLASQKSAMLPIVNDEVQGDLKAVYYRPTQEKHPMRAIELTNTTKLQLMQGPLTLFDAGEYAGDAQIEDLAPKAKRLITYALDLDIEVAESELDVQPEQFTTVKIQGGEVVVAKQQQRQRTYTIKNAHATPREVLVEQAIEAEWKLISPAAKETTRELYRFSVAAKPGEPAVVEVFEQRTGEQRSSAVVNDPFGEPRSSTPNDREAAFRLALSASQPSDAVKAALAQWREKHQVVAATNAKLRTVAQRVEEINKDQARIRPTLATLPEDSELYRRYVTILAMQEDELQRLRADEVKLSETLLGQTSDLDAFLSQLDVE